MGDFLGDMANKVFGWLKAAGNILPRRTYLTRTTKNKLIQVDQVTWVTG